MKILVVSAAFPPMKAGESDHCHRISEELACRGMEVEVLTTHGLDSPSAAAFEVNPAMTNWTWRDMGRLYKAVKRFKPEAVLLIYIGWIYGEHPMMTFAPTICRMIRPRPRVVTLFEYFSSWQPEKWGPETKLVRKAVELLVGRKGTDYEYGTLLRDSDAIITLSGKHTEALVSHDHGVERKNVLIPPPPLLKMADEPTASQREATRRKFGVSSEDFLIAYFGYMYPPKGVDVLIRALALVRKETSKAKLVLIGGVIAQKYPDWPTYAEDMKRLPHDLGIERSVIWIGEYAAESELPSQCLYASDICAFAHHHGVYLNNSSFAAAAAHGLPILATRPSIVEQPFADMQNLLFCEPKSPKALAEGILELMRNPALCGRLRTGARALAQQWYSWDAATDRILRACGSDVEGGNTTRPSDRRHTLAARP